jgi:hypothetical protein
MVKVGKMGKVIITKVWSNGKKVGQIGKKVTFTDFTNFYGSSTNFCHFTNFYSLGK